MPIGLAVLPALLLLAAPPQPRDAASPAHRREPVLFAEGVVSTGADDAHVTLTPDGRTAYFVRSTPDFAHWTVLVTRLEDGRWSRPEVAPFSGRWSDADVFLTRDGRRLLFVSNRPVDGTAPRPDTELWMMERTERGWGRPRHLAELTSPGDEWFPSMTDDGVLYFGSERPGGRGKSDLWRARWLGDRFGPPEHLGDVLNTPEQEIEPYVFPDGRTLVFAAKGRPGGAGEYDLFVSFSCDGRWSAPRPLGAGVNSSGWDFGPRVSPDGRTLFFTSNRSRHVTPPAPLGYDELMRRLESPGNGLRDVYQVELSALELHAPCER